MVNEKPCKFFYSMNEQGNIHVSEDILRKEVLLVILIKMQCLLTFLNIETKVYIH